MALRIPYYLFSHERKIANLYKKWLRHLDGMTTSREKYRYNAVLARAEFDVILKEKDMRKSKQMLIEKEAEFSEKFFLSPKKFPDSPGGPAYQREFTYPDYLLDYWHPLEKAMYPEYFAKREIRKQQFIELWEKKHGPPPPSSDDC